MSFPDPPPPSLPHFMQQPYQDGNTAYWHQMNNEFSDQQMQFDHAPSFKRPRNLDSNSNYQPMTPLPNNSNTDSSMNPTQSHASNKGTCHIFYKTRLCIRFMEGSCRNGDNCTFAHGHQDLRDPPPNWQDLVREKEKVMNNEEWNDDQRIISRMKICRKFYNGEECPYGEKCNFLHESPMKFRSDNNVVVPQRESASISVDTMRHVEEHKSNFIDVDQQSEINKNLNQIHDASRIKTSYWKTKLCMKFEKTGHCPFGVGCHFAHGQADLQAAVGEASNIGVVQARHVSSVPSTVNSNLMNNTIVKANVALGQEEFEATKDNNLLKWKAHRLLNRIYADWIDDDSDETED